LAVTALTDPEAQGRLARAAANGDESAFHALFELHRREVYRIARAVTGDREAARDAVQETFLKVHEALPRWRGDSSFRTWMFRIAVRAAIDIRRRSWRHRGYDAAAAEPGYDPRVSMEDALALKRVQELSEELPGQQGLILRLRLFGDLTNAEIGEALGLQPANVRMLLSRAVGRLREML
jgi:RNA polymerase sigma-70 factor, ECF subfamily